jgi:ubiquinone biosynthesis protein Coq4
MLLDKIIGNRLFIAKTTKPSFAALKPFLKLVKGNSSLEAVEEMTIALLQTPSYELALEHLKRDPDAATMIEQRYMAPPHDLKALLKYPSDSLGYIYASTMKEKGFRAEDLYLQIPLDYEVTYLEARLSQTHDIWHIVTGFTADEIDEIGLQAFHLPQFPYPLAVSLVSSGLMSVLLLAPEQVTPLLESIQQGWYMGKQAKPLFGQKWEEAWEKPLTQWREELNIIPVISSLKSDSAC